MIQEGGKTLLDPSSVQLHARAQAKRLGATGATNMKIVKPAKQRSEVVKSKRKVALLHMFFGWVKIIGYVFPIIDKYWPKIVEAFRELI